MWVVWKERQVGVGHTRSKRGSCRVLSAVLCTRMQRVGRELVVASRLLVYRCLWSWLWRLIGHLDDRAMLERVVLIGWWRAWSRALACG